MATTFFTDLFNSLDTATATLGSGMSNVLNIVLPAFEAVFIVYMMFVVWSYWQNASSIESTAIDLFKRIVGLGLLIGLGINYSTYSSVVFPFVTDFGDGLAQTWGGSATSTGSQLDGIIEKISQITDTNSADAQTALNNAPVAQGEPQPTQGIVDTVIGAASGMADAVIASTVGALGNEVMAFLQNIIIWISSAIFLVVSAAYLLVAQVMLILLAAIGPIFFGFALFPATRQFFTNWIGQVLNYGFLFLFMTISAEIFITYIDSQLDASKTAMMVGEYAVTANSMLSLMCMFVIFAVMLIQLPSLTSGLFGGLSAGGFGSLASAANATKRIVSGGKGSKGSGGASKVGNNKMKAEGAGR